MIYLNTNVIDDADFRVCTSPNGENDWTVTEIDWDELWARPFVSMETASIDPDQAKIWDCETEEYTSVREMFAHLLEAEPKVIPVSMLVSTLVDRISDLITGPLLDVVLTDPSIPEGGSRIGGIAQMDTGIIITFSGIDESVTPPRHYSGAVTLKRDGTVKRTPLKFY